MVSKTITIRKEVYEELRRIKGQDESFSDLLLRLAMNANGKKLERFLGGWKMDDVEWTKIQEDIHAARQASGGSRVSLE